MTGLGLCDYCFWGDRASHRDICAHLNSRELQMAVSARCGVWSPGQEENDRTSVQPDHCVDGSGQKPRSGVCIHMKSIQISLLRQATKAQLGKTMIGRGVFIGI